MKASSLFDFAVTTIFARECLEGAIIIGEYRTIVLRGEHHQALVVGLSQDDALTEITMAALAATALALLVIASIAIPLAILSTKFDASTAYIIEGISKIVAAISLLQLSLKLPKMFGMYKSCKKTGKRRRCGEDVATDLDNNNNNDDTSGLTRRSIRFNVAWNIWREVAECGIFLIPFFLNGQDLEKIPLSAVVGSVVGLACGYAIYHANRKLTSKIRLCVFAVLLLVLLSAGLFTGGSHKLEVELGPTKVVWRIRDQFWNVERLPMTIVKPFGYNDSRTVLEMCSYWSWLLVSVILHYRKYRVANSKNKMIIRSGDKDASISPGPTMEVSFDAATQSDVPKMIGVGDQSTITGLTFGDKTTTHESLCKEDSPQDVVVSSLLLQKQKHTTYVVEPEEAC